VGFSYQAKHHRSPTLEIKRIAWLLSIGAGGFAWFVATEVDGYFTYIAGHQAVYAPRLSGFDVATAAVPGWVPSVATISTRTLIIADSQPPLRSPGY
jgi:hypothetical protein